MSRFRADCSRCCGLCCVVPAQLALQGFRADKPAEQPCTHLDGRNRCSIHPLRASHGYPACAGFDCFGAGQWVTQQLFAGADWRHSAAQGRRMFAAYRHWLPRFEAAALLEAALPHAREGAHGALGQRLAQLTARDTLDERRPTDAVRLRRETLALIRTALAPGEAPR
jgi:hypothetical protein